MSPAPFIHLRIRSTYSIGESTIQPKALVDCLRRDHLPAAAITDRCNLFGAMEFSVNARKAGIQPIVGACLPTHAPARFETHHETSHASCRRAYPMPLIVQSEVGYRNLSHLISRAWSLPDQAVPFEYLTEFAEGLLLFSGGPDGLLRHHFASGHTPDQSSGSGTGSSSVRTFLETTAQAFPNRFYVELCHPANRVEAHLPIGDPARHPFDPATEEHLIELAYDLGLPLIATQDCRFLEPNGLEAAECLLAIGEKTLLGQPDSPKLSPESGYKTPEQMAEAFADIPEATANSVELVRRVGFMLEETKPSLPTFPGLGQESDSEALKRMAQIGLDARLDSVGVAKTFSRDNYRKRLYDELAIIDDTGFAGYFLIVADFVGWAKEKGIPVGPGRGSGAGSLVAWSMGITNLDPLRFGLLFERFLNPARVSVPDFDIDFCPRGRGRVIGYVQERYGTERVASIITFGTIKAKMAVRDAGRALGLPLGLVDRVARRIPFHPARPVDLGQAIAEDEVLAKDIKEDDTLTRLFAVARGIEGSVRNASTHAAGIVIADRPIEEVVPVYRDRGLQSTDGADSLRAEHSGDAAGDLPLTQFDMDWVEKVGLVKFDLLGLRTLTLIEDTLNLARASGQMSADFSLDHVPLDDDATFNLIRSGKTRGVFQLESAGMRATAMRLKPDRFEDLIALVALFRPGPMENIPSYIKRKHGHEPVDCFHASLVPALTETYGIPIYQEQVLQIARTLAGYSYGEADLLRRAMGKKIESEMAAQRQIFCARAIKTSGLNDREAQAIFDQIAAFAGYGFNKSHAAAYALISYHTAWLRAHFPLPFHAAWLSLHHGHTDELATGIADMKRVGIQLLSPCIQRSQALFSIEGEAIRFGLGAINNVGLASMEEVVKERTRNGAFRDIFDLVERSGRLLASRRTLECLARAGALDAVHESREQIFEQAEILARLAGSEAGQRGQVPNLFDLVPDTEVQVQRSLPDARLVWDAETRALEEFHAFGFFPNHHPLETMSPLLIDAGFQFCGDLDPTEEMAKIAFIRHGQRNLRAANGRGLALVVSDPSGRFELSCFGRSVDQLQALGPDKQRLAAYVRVEEREGDLRIRVDRVAELEHALHSWKRTAKGNGKKDGRDYINRGVAISAASVASSEPNGLPEQDGAELGIHAAHSVDAAYADEGSYGSHGSVSDPSYGDYPGNSEVAGEVLPEVPWDEAGLCEPGAVTAPAVPSPKSLVLRVDKLEALPDLKNLLRQEGSCRVALLLVDTAVPPNHKTAIVTEAAMRIDLGCFTMDSHTRSSLERVQGITIIK